MNNFLKRSDWSIIDRLAFAATVLIVFLMLFNSTLGRLEGYLMPVADDFHITFIAPSLNDQNADIWGELNLKRDECDFKRIEWVLDGQTRSVPVDVTFNEAIERSNGVQEFGPWHLNIPPEKIQYTRAVAYHQCPFKPWLTVTKLYP